MDAPRVATRECVFSTRAVNVWRGREGLRVDMHTKILWIYVEVPVQGYFLNCWIVISGNREPVLWQ